jgi:hypothetical protein
LSFLSPLHTFSPEKLPKLHPFVFFFTFILPNAEKRSKTRLGRRKSGGPGRFGRIDGRFTPIDQEKELGLGCFGVDAQPSQFRPRRYLVSLLDR